MINHINSFILGGIIMDKKDTKGRNLKRGEDQMPDGRYRFRYTDKNGKPKTIYSWKLVPSDKIPLGKRNDISLREKEKTVQKDLEDGIDTCSAEMTVNDLLARYFATKVKLSNATIENYIHVWEKNIKNTFLGKKSVGKVVKSDILKFYAYLYKDKRFAVGTIQLYQNILFPAFQLAVDDSILRMNPCKNCMKEYVRGTMSSDKYPLSRMEQRALLDFVNRDTTYNKYYVLIAFLLGTGCRIGEALGVTWNDINLKEKYVDIDHQVIYKKKDGHIQFYSDLPKNKLSRRIPIQESLVKILTEYKQKIYFISKCSDFKVDKYSNFVFLNSECRLYTPNTIVRAFHGIRNAYNKEEESNAYFEERDMVLLPDFTPHILRHTFCTRMAENNMNIKVLQTIMGHKTIAVTMQVYNHVNNEWSQKEVEKVEDVLVLKAI